MKGLQFLSVLDGKGPGATAALVIALMAFGTIPVSLPLAGIIAALAILPPIANKLIDKQQAKKTSNPKLDWKPPKDMLLLILIPTLLILTSVGLLACSATHPLASPAALDAAWTVTKPYIIDGCKEFKPYLGYDLDFNDPDNLHHGFGGILGGCGSYGKVTCWVIVNTDCASPRVDCPRESVKCALSDHLISDPDFAPVPIDIDGDGDGDDDSDGDADEDDDSEMDEAAFKTVSGPPGA